MENDIYTPYTLVTIYNNDEIHSSFIIENVFAQLELENLTQLSLDAELEDGEYIIMYSHQVGDVILSINYTMIKITNIDTKLSVDIISIDKNKLRNIIN